MKLPNIVVRILAGAVFVALLVGGIIVNEYTFVVLFSLIVVLGLYEFYGLIEQNAKAKTAKSVNIIGGILLFAGAYASQTCCISMGIIAFIPYLVYLILLFVSELYLKRTDPLKSLAYAVLGQMYIALPFALLNLIAFEASGYNYVPVLAIFVFIWVNDSFAYLTGMAFGKHRLFERISPKKSWEGFIGGTIFAIASSYIFYRFDTLDAKPLWFWMGFAATTVVFGTWGDLIESLMKRTLGVKDSGNMIPGHGGLLDRFDSTIFAIPAVVVYITLAGYFL